MKKGSKSIKILAPTLKKIKEVDPDTLEEIEKQFQHMKETAKRLVEEKTEELEKDLRGFVNQRVNRFSQIQVVVAQLHPFEKTATKKIKRYLYK